MSLIRVYVKGISFGPPESGTYIVILSDSEDQKKLPIVVGAFEAQAISLALDREYSHSRPLTHDLFRNLFVRFHINLKQVVIHKLDDQIFYSHLVCQQDQKEEYIDARSSDAIALALHFDAPIFVYKDIMEQAGAEFPIYVEKNRTLHQHSLQELEDLLQKAVAVENYTRAAELRDEINRRKACTPSNGIKENL